MSADNLISVHLELNIQISVEKGSEIRPLLKLVGYS